MIALAGLLAGCDAGSPDHQPVDAPAVRLLDVTVATEDASKHQTSVLLDPNGTTFALPTTTFRLRFSRFLLPVTAVRQSMCLQSLIAPVATLDECKLGVSYTPAYDPVRREITIRLPSPLAEGTRYQLTVLAPPDAAAANGVRAFDGAPLEANVSFEFTTLKGAPAFVEPKPGQLFCHNDACAAACPAKASVKACQAACAPKDAACAAGCVTSCQQNVCAGAQSILSTCAYGNCHADKTDPPGTFLGAAEGLKLRNWELMAATAFNHVAHETQEGERATAPDRSPVRFGRAMPIIDPGSPGNSYLLYKLLVGPSPQADAAPGADEVARLRASVVVGMPMAADGSSLGQDKLDTLSAWIGSLQPDLVPVTCP